MNTQERQVTNMLPEALRLLDTCDGSHAASPEWREAVAALLATAPKPLTDLESPQGPTGARWTEAMARAERLSQ